MSELPRGKIDLATLRRRVDTGEIDTVISALCDMQGRLVGKRVTGRFFVDHCVEHGTHFCVYVLGTDMEMTTPSGFPGLSWESGTETGWLVRIGRRSG